MALMLDYTRSDYMHGREPVLNWYKTAKADAAELDAFLKVETADDAVRFMDKFAPLFHYGIKTRVRKPSDIDAETLSDMVADVLNSVKFMKFAIETQNLIKNNATFDTINENGYHPHFIGSSPYEEAWGDEFQEIALFVGEDFNFGVGHVSCSYAMPLMPAGRYISAGRMEDIECGHFAAGSPESGDDEAGYLLLRSVAWDGGESDDTYRQALADMIDRLFRSFLSGVRLAPKRMQQAYSAADYNSFLWYALFERLTAGEIRRCNVCGKYFVANLGDANERGGSPKTTCGVNCRQIGFKARKAKKLIDAGMDMKAAAKEAHISISRLQTYLQLNPLESEGANNG